MLQTTTHLLTERLGDSALYAVLLVAALGVFVWLLGGRFSKSVLALIGVGLGAWVGMNLPQWFGWHFDGMALAMGGALLAGFGGYLLHTTWLGGALVANLALLFGYSAWVARAGNATWQLPSISDWSIGQVEILRTVWSSMPGDLPRVMPYAVAMGVISAVATSVLWPRVAKCMSWSLIGIELMLVGGAVAMTIAKPGTELAAYVPTSAGARVGVLWGLALLGMLVQWWSLPARDQRPPKPTDDDVEKPKVAPNGARPAAVPGGTLATGGVKA